MIIGAMAIGGIVAAGTTQTTITAGNINTVGDITADKLSLGNTLNMSPDKSIKVYADTSDTLGSDPQSIELYALNPQSKAYLAWNSWYNNGGTMTKDWIGWFGCHYNTSINGDAHQHCSIETNDLDTGTVNTRFEISYGKTLANMYAQFSGINYLLFGSGVDLRFTSPAEIYPNGGTTIGLMINNTATGNLELSAKGSTNITIQDNLIVNTNTFSVLNTVGNLPTTPTGEVAKFVRNGATSNSVIVSLISGNGTGTSNLYFGDEQKAGMGIIQYDNADNTFHIQINDGTKVMNVSSYVAINSVLNLNPRSLAPGTVTSGLTTGSIYYDSDTNTVCFYNSTAWVDMTGRGLTCA